MRRVTTDKGDRRTLKAAATTAESTGLVPWRKAPSQARPGISYYTSHVDAHETIDGVAVTEEQIASWAAEAAAGYDIRELRQRGRGRPGRGAEPSQVVTLRLTLAELAAIDARAARDGKSRSEVIREALAASAA